MSIRTIGFMDVTRVAASFVATHAKRLHDAADVPGMRVLVVDPLEPEWPQLATFLAKLRGEATPLFNGNPPIIEAVEVRSLTPGFHLDWYKLDAPEVHICIAPSPGAWVYAGGDAAVLAFGNITLVGGPTCEINLGPVTMTKLTIRLGAPSVDA